MNVHKRLLAILLVLVVVLMMPISAQANSLVAAMDDLYDQYVISYMKNVMHSNVTIRSKSDVKNLNQEECLIYYILNTENGNGYVILDTETLIIPECSLESTLPITVNDSIIYGGILTYLNKKSGAYYDIMSGKNVEIATVSRMREMQEENKQRVLTETEKIQRLESIRASESVIRTVSGAGNSSWLFKSGRYYGDCGINCIAMLEKYYDLYVNSNYLPSTLTTESQIKQSINAYITNYTGFSTTLIDENNLDDIISQHSYSLNTSHYLYANTSTYSWSTAVSKVTSNRPLAITIRNHPDFGYHYVIVCGYADTADLSTSRLYINSGWTDPGYVWIDQSYGYKQIPCV